VGSRLGIGKSARSWILRLWIPWWSLRKTWLLPVEIQWSDGMIPALAYERTRNA
jgi:hypothetical protein